MNRSAPIDSIHFGLGPIGLRILETGVRIGLLSPRAAIDIDPAGAAARLAEARLVVPVASTLADLPGLPPRTVAIHATTSRARDVVSQVRSLVERGLSVVSTCEELAFPVRANLPVREELDAAARRHGVAVIATGVNPGMVMDSLVIHLAAAMTNIERVRVERTVDTATRRGPLRRKTGVGLDRAGFTAAVEAGAVGHVGLRESCAMVASALGWDLDHVLESIAPVTDGAAILGLHQTARGVIDGEVRIELDLRMVDGATEPGDRITLAGAPPIDVRIVGGMAGDEATVGAVLNQVARIDRLPPGFHTLIDAPDCGAVVAGRVAPPATAGGRSDT